MTDLLNKIYLPETKKRDLLNSNSYRVIKDAGQDPTILEGYENNLDVNQIEFPVFNTQADKDKFAEDNANSATSVAKEYLETFGNFLTDETEDLLTSMQLAAVNGADVATNLMPLAYKMFEKAPIAMAMPPEFFSPKTEEEVMKVSKHFSENLGEYREHLFEKQKDNGWVKDILSLVVQDSAYSIPAYNFMRKAGMPKYPSFFLSAAIGAVGVENEDRDGEKTYFAPYAKDVAKLKELIGILPNTPEDEIADEIHQALEYGAFGFAIPGIIDVFKFMKRYVPAMAGTTGASVGMFADNEAEGSPVKAIVNAVNKAPVFKSAVIDATTKLPNKASGEQIFKTISNTPGVKASELKWMDLEAFLKDKKNVTKDEVLEFISANRIDVTEVMFPRTGKDFGMYDEMLESAELRQTRLFNEYFEEKGIPLDSDNYTFFNTLENGTKIPEKMDFSRFQRTDISDTLDSFKDVNTKIYDTDAILKTFPHKTNPNLATFYLFEDSASGQIKIFRNIDIEGDPVKYTVDNPNSGGTFEYNYQADLTVNDIKKYAAEAEVRELKRLKSLQEGTTRYEQYTSVGGDDYKELILKYRQLGELGGRKPIPLETGVTKYDNIDNFDIAESPHFNEPNELANVRFKTRELSNGKKVLAVEEMQSDLVQAVKQSNKDMLEDANEFVDKYGEVESLEAMDKVIKDFPFKNNWYELAIKRLTRYAADNGFDAISVPKGSVVQDRYNLVRKFDSIEIGSFDLARREIGIEAQDQNGVLQISELMKFENLEKRFGKDIAERIINKGKTLKQADYDNGNNSVTFNQPIIEGGEGKNSLYDKAIPAYLKKYAKKFNAKVYDDKLGRKVFDDEINDMVDLDPIDDIPVTVLELSDEMKVGVQSSSQPLFELLGGVSLATWGAQAVSDNIENNIISQKTN